MRRLDSTDCRQDTHAGRSRAESRSRGLASVHGPEAGNNAADALRAQASGCLGRSVWEGGAADLSGRVKMRLGRAGQPGPSCCRRTSTTPCSRAGTSSRAAAPPSRRSSAATPEPGSWGWWDRLTGATDSAARWTERRREDAAALALAGRATARSTCSTSNTGQRTRARVGGGPRGGNPRCRVVYAPLGLFLSFRSSRWCARPRSGSIVTCAYTPTTRISASGACRAGSRRADAAALDVDGAWRAAMLAQASLRSRCRRTFMCSTTRASRASSEAVRAYRTQVAALVRGPSISCAGRSRGHAARRR